jgi:hypothetical protein
MIRDYAWSVLSALEADGLGLDFDIRQGIEQRLGMLLAETWDRVGGEIRVDNLLAFVPEADRDEAAMLWSWLNGEE